MRTRTRIGFLIAVMLLVAGSLPAQTSVGLTLGESTGRSATQWIGEGASISIGETVAIGGRDQL
ncbi:MAG: hypothetical protein ACOC2D_19810 [Spirochaetota bacterium]